MSSVPIRILHLEDNEADSRMIGDLLDQAGLICALNRVDGREALLAALGEDRHDIVLCDYNLPGYGGLRAIADVRRLRPELPVLIVSGSIGEAEAVKCLHHGATDYLLKQKLDRFVPALRRALQEAAAGRAQREAEAALRASEEKFRQLAENIQEAFWISDPAKEAMIYISPAYETIWGRTCASLYARPQDWMEAIHPEDRDRVRRAALTKQATGTYKEVYRIVRPDGGIRWIRDRAFPVRDGTGRVYRIVGTAEDITEQKGIEQQLLHTQRLENVARLADGVAHDLNNLLAPILMGVELLRLKTADPGLHRLIDSIGQSALRGKELVQQVLSFAHGMGDGQVPVTARNLIRDLQAVVANTFPKNITVDYRVPADLWLISGDAGQLSQVLLNLCMNARDAMPQGGVIAIQAENIRIDTLYAGTQRELAPGRYLRLTVTDTGPGMAPEVRSRLFEPFFSTKPGEAGTGLGLPVSQRIVQDHGGCMEVLSEVGRGSSFRVYLPALGQGAPAGGSANPFGELPRGRDELVLVVDDEVSVLEIMRETLEAFGYRVLTAEDGAQAVAVFAARQEEIGLVLTDMMMPVMDGAALIAAVRRLKPGVGIIAVSGVNATYNPTRLAELGIPHFIAKPFTAPELLAMVRKVLTGLKPDA